MNEEGNTVEENDATRKAKEEPLEQQLEEDRPTTHPEWPEVQQWLRRVDPQFSAYDDIFYEQQLWDMEAIRYLTDAYLKEMGLLIGPRAKLMKAIRQLQAAHGLPDHVIGRVAVGVPGTYGKLQRIESSEEFVGGGDAVSGPPFYLKFSGHLIRIVDVDVFFREGRKYLNMLCKQRGAVLPRYVACETVSEGWFYADVAVPEDQQRLMMALPEVTFTDQNPRQRQYRASLSISVKLAAMAEHQENIRQHLDRLKEDKALLVVSVDKILKHCGFGKLERIEGDAENLVIIESLLSHSYLPALGRIYDVTKAKPEWKDYFSTPPVHRTRRGLIQVEIPRDVEEIRHMYLSHVDRELQAENVDEAVEEQSVSTSRNVFGSPSATFVPCHNRQDPEKLRHFLTSFWIANECELCEIMWMNPLNEGFSLPLFEAIKSLKEQNVNNEWRGFSLGIIARGLCDYMLVLQPQQEADGRCFTMITPPTNVYSGLYPLPDLLLHLVRMAAEPVRPGLISRTPQRTVARLIKRGGQSFVFESQPQQTSETKCAIKFLDSSDGYDKAKGFHDRIGEQFGELFVSALSFDPECWAVSYEFLDRLENERFTLMRPEPWLDFVDKLWIFHENTSLVHMDICPNNLLIKYDRIKLADFSSWCEKDSHPSHITSTPPYFSYDLLEDGVTTMVDHVMLLRTIDWVLCGHEQFHSICDEGRNVVTCDDLKDVVRRLFSARINERFQPS